MSDGGCSDACASPSGSFSGEWSAAEAEQGPVSSPVAACSDSDAWSAACGDGEAAEPEEDANAPLELCPCPGRRRRSRPKKRVDDAPSSKATMGSQVRALQPGIGAAPGVVTEPVPASGELTVSEGAIARLRRPPKLGEPHPLITSVQEAFVRAQAAPSYDEDAHQIARTLLGGTAVATSGQGVLVDAMGSTRKMYLPRFYSTCELALISCRATRWELEEGLAKPLPGVECILYIDAARYDETPMLVKSRGQSSFGQLLGTSASAAQPAAGEEIVRGMALPMVPLVNQSQIMNMLSCQSPFASEVAVTSSPAAKILQSESRSAILLKVDKKYVVVVSSGMCVLFAASRKVQRPLLASCAD